MRHVCLAFMVIGDDGLDHRKLPREDQAGIESVDSRKLPRDDQAGIESVDSRMLQVRVSVECNDQRIAHTISITKGRERVLLILFTTAITSAVASQLFHPS